MGNENKTELAELIAALEQARQDRTLAQQAYDAYYKQIQPALQNLAMLEAEAEKARLRIKRIKQALVSAEAGQKKPNRKLD